MRHRHSSTRARARTRQIVALGVLLMLVLNACGSEDTNDTTTSSTASTTTTTASTTLATTTTAEPATTITTTTAAPATTTAAPAGGRIEVTSEGDFGTHLVDESGMSLYLFLPDAQGASTCTSGCAATWPPFTIEVSAGTGVDPGLLGTVDRDDGARQVTYNGWPLYHYSGDLEPGDAFGQGLGSAWFLVAPDGTPVGQAS